MELISAGTLIVLTLISLPILAALLKPKLAPISSTKRRRRRPPGPWNIPFLGSLPHLLRSETHVALRDLAAKYGPVMFLRVGQIDTVVISSPAAAQEVLQEKDVLFASRPSLLSSSVFSYGDLDIGFAPYGAYWRTLRKLCTLELLSTKMVRRLAPARDAETLSLVRNIITQSTSRCGEPINLTTLLLSCSNAITAKAAFGQVCSGELQEQFLSALDVALKAGGGFSFGDLFPSLRFVDALTGVRARMWRAHRQLDAVYDKLIARCEAQRGDDLLSVLLRIRDEGGFEFPIGTTNIKAIILDMSTGGTETTSTTAEWIMSELMRHPEAMAKVQAEVRRVFDGRSPREHEALMDQLTYMRMVIKETMRLHPVLPLLVPHLCRETCDVGGYEVRAGTRVFVNAWAISRSNEYWDDADKFMPERFENSEIGFKGTQFHYLPFGTGRRSCPGDTFGLAVLELIVARLLYYSDWSLPAGMRPDQINMDMVLRSTMRRKHQLQLVASPYKLVP